MDIIKRLDNAYGKVSYIGFWKNLSKYQVYLKKIRTTKIPNNVPGPSSSPESLSTSALSQSGTFHLPLSQLHPFHRDVKFFFPLSSLVNSHIIPASWGIQRYVQ